MGTRLIVAAVLALGVRGQELLPRDATVIERASVAVPPRGQREIILWMLSPEKSDRGPNTRTNPYTCPEATTGSYYSGPTRVSLVDKATDRVLNTIRISPDERDTFEIPFRIVPDYYYLVPDAAKGVEGKPRLLALRDLNGDGQALEFAFYRAWACMGLATTLIGYSPKQDRLIQYPVDLTLSNGTVESVLWPDYLFSKRPNQAGVWSFEIDYSGRGGSLDQYVIRHDKEHEKFVGTLRSTVPPPIDRRFDFDSWTL